MTTQASPTLLIVEDERTLADLYAKWLQEEYAVEQAYDGETALEWLDESVEVVLLDRRMPGLSGDDVLEEIRERGLDIRVAMVTAVEPDFDIVNMGFEDYLVKPVTKEELQTTVERLLARTEYTGKVDEYASLVAKKAALEAEKTETELAASEEFAALQTRIEELREELDPMARDFDEEDVIAVLRDIPTPSEV